MPNPSPTGGWPSESSSCSGSGIAVMISVRPSVFDNPPDPLPIPPVFPAVQTQLARSPLSGMLAGAAQPLRNGGVELRQLHWHYWLPGNAAIPQLNHSNPRYVLAVTMWRKMPLWCANLIGPRIAKNLP